MTTFLSQSQEQGNSGEADQSFSTESLKATDNTNQSSNEPYLSVGDRVFKSKEDVINHITHAQNHISKLEGDFNNATQLIEKQSSLLEQSSKFDDVLDAVNNRQDSSGNAEETPKLSKDEVIADALRAFEQHQQQQTLEQRRISNFNSVSQVLTKAYGDKTDEVVTKVAAENGLSLQEAAEIAKSHPKVFLKMFDTNTQQRTAQPTHSSVNTQALGYQESTRPRKKLTSMSGRERAAYVQQMLSDLDNR